MSTVAKSTKKSTPKKATPKRAPVAKAAPKNGNGKNGAVQALRQMIVKTWPNVPTVEALEKSSGLPKARVLMYRGSMSRTLKLAKELGPLK